MHKASPQIHLFILFLHHLNFLPSLWFGVLLWFLDLLVCFGVWKQYSETRAGARTGTPALCFLILSAGICFLICKVRQQHFPPHEIEVSVKCKKIYSSKLTLKVFYSYSNHASLNVLGSKRDKNK
jgi:hypothetical protein